MEKTKKRNVELYRNCTFVDYYVITLCCTLILVGLKLYKRKENKNKSKTKKLVIVSKLLYKK